MAITTVGFWPVNENGEILLQAGRGTDKVVNYLNQDGIPVDVSTMKAVVKLPASVPEVGFPLVVQAIGDSIVDYGQTTGRVVALPTTPATTGIILQGGSLTWPDGVGSISFNAKLGTLKCKTATDGYGEEVFVGDGGEFNISTGTAGVSLRVGVQYPFLPTVNTVDTLTPGVSTWTKNTGAWMYQVDAATFGRFTFLEPLGISGDRTSSMTKNRYAQAVRSSSKIVLDVGGTNDIQLANATPESIVSNRSKFWDDCRDAGKIIVAYLISPRWGKLEDGSSGADVVKYSATFQARIVACNRLLVEASKSRPWVRIVDTYSQSTDATQANGAVKNGWTPDGLHPGGALAWYGYALPTVRILNAIAPEGKMLQNVGAGAYYNVNNVGGNLLASNQGAFAGSTGTFGAGCSATPVWVTGTVYAAESYVISSGNLYVTSQGGTSGATQPSHTRGTVTDGGVTWEFLYSGVTAGLATGVSCARGGTGATVTGTFHKMTATDGGQDWQVVMVKGSAFNTDNIGMFLSNLPGANWVAGDTIQSFVEFMTVGYGCYSVRSDLFLTGGTFSSVQANQFNSVFAGLKDTNALLTTLPYTVQTGVSSVGVRIYTAGLVGKSYEIRFRNADVHKVSK